METLSHRDDVPTVTSHTHSSLHYSPTMFSLPSLPSFVYGYPTPDAFSDSNSDSDSESLSSLPTSKPTTDKKGAQWTRCSPLQQEWVVKHPVFKAVNEKGTTIRNFLNKLANHSTPAGPLIHNLSVLQAPSNPSLFNDKPQLADYVQRTTHLWIPDYFFPHLVDFMPCPVPGCKARTRRRRWKKGGPRLIHGVHSAEYLHCWDYQCEVHPTSFKGWDNGSISKLPAAVRSAFRFVLKKEEGVTLELHRRIVAARVSGSSLNALRRELLENRHVKMMETIAAYYQHCEQYIKKQETSLRSYLTVGGKGETPSFPPMPPDLHNPSAYFDWEPPTVSFLSDLAQEYCSERETLWTRHTQQLTADRVCIDATFKVAKKIQKSGMRLLWSLMDVETSCILHQQMLTHEKHADVLPMLESYAARCREMEVALPTRVCSDRGLMDCNIINDPAAFPNAHINVDPWHFHALFTKTLNKVHPLWKEAAQKFKEAMYVDVELQDGRMSRTHADPQHILTKVEDLLNFYSLPGTSKIPCVTASTKAWWDAQKSRVRENRICSQPTIADDASPIRMASSPLENFHKQLNRLVRLARCSEASMHGFLLHFLFRWNVDRRRAAGKERDWKTYDFILLDNAFTSCVRAVGKAEAMTIWDGGFSLPPEKKTVEHFGIHHLHVTWSERINAASDPFPFSSALVSKIFKDYSGKHPLLSPAAVQKLIESIPPSTPFSSTPTSCPPLSSASSPSLAPPPFPSPSSSALPSSSSLTPQAPQGTPPSTVALPPTRQMTWTELELLSSLLRMDELLRDLVEAAEWDQAAGRWNSFIRQCNGDPASRSVFRDPPHYVVGEVLQKGVQRLSLEKQRQEEKEVMQLKASTPHIKWQFVSPAEEPFTLYEDGVLAELVAANGGRATVKVGKKKISWRNIVSKWLTRYRAESEAGSKVCLHPRSDTVLKSHWQSLSVKVSASSTPSSTSSLLPPPPSTIPSSSPVSTSASAQSSECALPRLPSSPLPLPSPPSTAAPQPPLQPCPPTPTPTSLTSLLNYFLPSPSSSTVLSTASPLPSSSTPPPSSPLPHPSSPRPNRQSASTYKHWEEAATSCFNLLWKAHDYQWTYEQFLSAWPAEQHGAVGYHRWLNKNKREKRLREVVQDGAKTGKKGTKRQRKV
jgi:hypothetical protein